MLGRGGRRIGTLFLALFLPILLSPPPRAEGRVLNLGGTVDLRYGQLRTRQNEIVAETSFLQQRYHLSNFGEIIDPRLGTFSMNASFLSQDARTRGDLTDQDFHSDDYSIALNLFPYISPLNLYAQRVVRSNELDVIVKDRVTTYGANWSLSIPRFPRLALSYNQSELKANDPDRFPDTLSRFVNVESSGRMGATTLIGRYQFNQSDIARPAGGVDSIRGQGVNLTTESRLSPALALSSFTRYANVAGVNAPGLTFSQERGIGASLFYTPSVYWDTHARVEYSEIPDSIAFSRLLAFWSGSIRPTERLDMVVSARYFQFDVNRSKTSAPFTDFNVNYRPFFGLTAGAGASVGETRTEGYGAESRSFYQRVRSYVNYTRSVEILRYTASYGLSYGTADTTREGLGAPASEEIKDLMNTVSLGVENTQIRIVHIAMAYTFNDIKRDGPTVQLVDDQRSHLFQVNVDSSYFRGIFSQNDSLLLQSTASLTRIEGFGPDGNSFAFDARGNYYFWEGASFSGGLTHQDFPEGFYSDSDTFFEEIQWSFYLGAANVTLGGRDSHQRSRENSALERDTLEMTAALGYQIGKFIFNLDHRWANDRSAGVVYTSETLFARATRIF